MLIPVRGRVSPSVAVTDSAEVFAGKARELLDELHHDRARHEQYQFALAKGEASDQKSIDFWYRQSPIRLTPEQTPMEFFTWRSGTIRIIGAGYWRKGKLIYERENKILR